MKLADALLTALKDRGAGEVFGIPGDFALPFFARVEASGILPLVTLSHEPGLGFAADAAGRWRGTLGVAAITYGAGALNMVNPIACAYAEKSPLVVVSGAPGAGEGTTGLVLHHQVKNLDSQMRVMREVTAAQCVLDDPATAPAEIARVLDVARNLSRPVYIELPRDMVEVEIGPVPPFRPSEADPEATRACAEQVMRRLRAADRPAILLGVELRRFGCEDAAVELVRRLGLPAATTFMARGIGAGEGSPVRGTYLGLAGDESLRGVIEDADALLMLGVILADTNFGVSAKQIDMRGAIHAEDGAVRFATHAYPGVTLPALLNAMLEIAEPLGEAPAADPMTLPGGMAADAVTLTPEDIAAVVNDSFAAHGPMPIASDMGDCLFTAMDMAHVPLVAPGYYATMGTGIPFGIGVAVASGERSLILVGDGAFQMTGWELGHCARLGIAPVVIVFNNAAWGMLKVFQEGRRYNDLDTWRYADLAEGLGGTGRRVATRAELAEALDAARADSSRWHLIEAMLPRDSYSPILSRFVGAIRQRSVLGKG